MNPLIKQTSAWIPIAMSLTVLAAMLIVITLSGVPEPQADEGTGAHLFQLWLFLETFMVAFFAIKWLPQNPKEALLILTIQIIAALAACAPVFLLHL